MFILLNPVGSSLAPNGLNMCSFLLKGGWTNGGVNEGEL